MRAVWLGATVAAWWDEGHMLIAAVARDWLLEPGADLPWTAYQGSEIVQKYDQLLGYWRPDFPHFDTLVSAAVWADHIKCRSRSTTCESVYGIELFNDEHFIDILYNTSLSDSARTSLIQAAMGERDNAYYLLSLLETSFSSSSKFSANLSTRLFLHIFGDIFQPLHAVRYQGDCFPHGDRGGNEIKIRLPARSASGLSLRGLEYKPATLHGLWDSGGGLFTGSYPSITVEAAEHRAGAIRKAHGKLIQQSIADAVSSSYYLAETIYKPLLPDLCTESPNITSAPNVIMISPEYLSLVQRLSELRIAEAGYSLAFYLARFADRIGTTREVSLERFSTKGELALEVYAVFVSLILVSVLITIWFFYRRSVRNAPKRSRAVGSSHADRALIDPQPLLGEAINVDPAAWSRVIVSKTKVELKPRN